MSDIVGYIFLAVVCVGAVAVLVIVAIATWQEQQDLSKCRRGLVDADISATNILTGRTRDYSSGYHEVWIVEETTNMYKVRWKNNRFEQSDSIPKWIPKSECKVIEE
jgi:hypothetical protein